MSIDDQVAIMGNGNMDSQSWFHSQVNKYEILFYLYIQNDLFHRKSML